MKKSFDWKKVFNLICIIAASYLIGEYHGSIKVICCGCVVIFFNALPLLAKDDSKSSQQ